MQILKEYRLLIACSLAGMFLGYLIIHPFSMIMSAIAHIHQSEGFHLHWKNIAGSQALETFKPVMLQMGVAFAVLGGVIGLLVGIIVVRRERLHEAELKIEKKRIALQTMKKLMVTLSHYLLNANMIIGGKVRHCQRRVSDQDILASLAAIDEQGRKIDAVIKALRQLTDIKTANYTTDGQILMIDITQELQEQLSQVRETSAQLLENP